MIAVKKIWIFLKTHWYIPLLLIVGVVLKSKSDSLLKIIDAQKETYEKKRADDFINKHKETSRKINIVHVRASPIMEFLTGIMIACLIFVSAKLVMNNELEVSNFFSFLAAMMLA